MGRRTPGSGTRGGLLLEQVKVVLPWYFYCVPEWVGTWLWGSLGHTRILYKSTAPGGTGTQQYNVGEESLLFFLSSLVIHKSKENKKEHEYSGETTGVCV
jgi:hypothetical protein